MATVTSTYTDPNSATLDKATGATIDETMTDAWSSNFRHTHGSVGYIGCRVAQVGSQSVTTATATAIAMSSEEFDSDPNGAMHDNVTNNSRITFQTAGVYFMEGRATFQANSTGYRQIYIRWNGGVALTVNLLMAVTTGDITQVSVATAAAMSVGDYIELIVSQNSGISLAVTFGGLVAVK